MENEEDEASKSSNPCFRSEDDALNVTAATLDDTAAMHSQEELQRNGELQCQSESTSVAEVSESRRTPEPQREQPLGEEKDGDGDPIGGEKGGAETALEESRLGGGDDESQPSASPVPPEPKQEQSLCEKKDKNEDSIREEKLAEANESNLGEEGDDLREMPPPPTEVLEEDNGAVAGEIKVEDEMEAGDLMVVSEGKAEDLVRKEEGQDLDTKTPGEVADLVEDTEEKADMVRKAETIDETGAASAADIKETAEEEEKKDADVANEIENVETATVDGAVTNVIEEEKDAVLGNKTEAAQDETVAEATTGLVDERLVRNVGEETMAEDREIREEMGVDQWAEQMNIGDGDGEAEMGKEMVNKSRKDGDDVTDERGIQDKMEVADAAEEAQLAREMKKETEKEVAEVTEETVTGEAQVVEEVEKERGKDGADVAEGTGIEDEMEVGDAAGEEDIAEESEKEEEVEMGDVAEETANADDVVAEETEEAQMFEEVEKDDAAGEMETEVDTPEQVEKVSGNAGGKRKRGKNSRSASKGSTKKKSEEDVCFICFDGGELVLCDRRGCPKAYHPSCVNRDEAFFRSKGRWNCGWHLCSICEKNAHYMCYTCTFSLCKACIKNADILCVRGNKGFCETCMKTVTLIEKKEQGNKEVNQVDFDDKSSWEYLFKDYWFDLKGRLSLSYDEIANAKNPRKGSDKNANKHNSHDELYDANDDAGPGSDSDPGSAEATASKRRKLKRRSKSRAKEDDSPSVVRVSSAEGASTGENVEWASKELLDLVMHMRDGDKSVLSQFDVQTLLLDYIKKYKLRDPHRRTHVICDARLQNLFGKPRVGHFEMLKLLESHFLVKEDSQVDDVEGSVVDTEANQETDAFFDTPIRSGKEKRRKSRKRPDERGLQSNVDDYAAIDMHNINLIYLRRNLAEELLEDGEAFHEKAIGCFVRIRISNSIQKQDLYRLVQVTATTTVPEQYKVGKRMTDIMLETLNLNKTEVVSIDTISNQDFTEDECKRLRQSIKCGLISPLTVGDIQEKAVALQEARVKDAMEAEINRLSHLRDRASDMGRRKELRECVEKLQLLKTPEERQRRMEEIPRIHSDPNMDPSHESEEEEEPEEKKQENYLRPRGSSFSRRGREPISPGRGGFTSNDSFSGTSSYTSGNRELNRSLSNRGFSNRRDDFIGGDEIVNENLWNQGREKEMQRVNSWEKQRAASDLESGPRNPPPVVLPEPGSQVVPELAVAAAAAPRVTQPTVQINESEKMWHYKDPAGKIQGPFSIVQLRKWSNTGYFPADLRIWKSTETQDDSILLTNALAGKFHTDPPLASNNFAKAQTVSLPEHNLTTQNVHGSSLREGMKFQSEMSPLDVPKRSRWSPQTSLPSPTPSRSTPTEIKGQAFERDWSPTPSKPSGMYSPTPSETPRVQANAQQLPATTSVAAMNPDVDIKAIGANLQSLVQSVSAQIPVENRSWGSNLAARPEMNAPSPKPNNTAAIPSQPPAFAQPHPSSGVFRPPAQTGMPQSDPWRPPVPPSQPSIQHNPSQSNNQPNMPWGMNVAGTNQNSVPRPGPENQNMGWGPMPGNPNIGWGGQPPAGANMVYGNVNSGWAPPPAAPAAVPGPGQGPGNAMPGWGPPPMNANPGWAGQPPGNVNPGWAAPPAGNPGMWGNEPNRGPQVGDSGYGGGSGGNSGGGGGRGRNRQSSFSGRGGGDSSRGAPSFNKGQRVCKFHENGHCKKGSQCDYMHT